MAQESTSSSGIGGALRQVLGSLTEGVRYRGELFALELTEEKNSLISLLLLAMAALFSLFLSFLCLNILLLVLFWDQRAILATVLMLIYLLMAAVLGLIIRHRIKHAPKPFDTTLEVLRKDQETLTRGGHGYGD
jgi:uncharacterized membrane protein YqjE